MTVPQPRYFYTDPLAAAWMAKHFSMKFLTRRGPGYRCLNTSELMIAAHLKRRTAYFIDPESQHLLEPQEGDLCYSMGEHVIYPPKGDNFALEYCRRVVHSNVTSPHATGRIIQRNGVAFHWPESEAA